MSVLARDHQNHRIQAIRAETVQKVAVGAGSVPTTNAMQGETSIVIVTSDVDCLYLQGDTPVVTAGNGHPLWAKQPVFVRVRPGKDKFAFIQNGADTGSAWVSEGGDGE